MLILELEKRFAKLPWVELVCVAVAEPSHILESKSKSSFGDELRFGEVIEHDLLGYVVEVDAMQRHKLEVWVDFAQRPRNENVALVKVVLIQLVVGLVDIIVV